MLEILEMEELFCCFSSVGLISSIYEFFCLLLFLSCLFALLQIFLQDLRASTNITEFLSNITPCHWTCAIACNTG